MSDVVFTYRQELHFSLVYFLSMTLTVPLVSGTRRNNSTAILAGKSKFSSPLFFRLYMPFYIKFQHDKLAFTEKNKFLVSVEMNQRKKVEILCRTKTKNNVDTSRPTRQIKVAASVQQY